MFGMRIFLRQRYCLFYIRDFPLSYSINNDRKGLIRQPGSLILFGSKLFSKNAPLTCVEPLNISNELRIFFEIDNKYKLYEFFGRVSFRKRLYDEVDELLHVCNRSIAFKHIMMLVDMCTWHSRKEELRELQLYTKKRYPKEYISYGQFVPQKALCQHISEPLDGLMKLLTMLSSNTWPKAVVMAQVDLLFHHVIYCRSRCIVDKVNEFICNNYQSELNGPLLCSIWVSFYLSPYEVDQKRATEILRKYEHKMMHNLDNTLIQMAEYLLDGRQLNRYYVLLQMFSKGTHAMRSKKLLEMLFYYFYNSNNLKGCGTCVSLLKMLNLQIEADVTYKFEMIKKSGSIFRKSIDMTFIF